MEFKLISLQPAVTVLTLYYRLTEEVVCWGQRRKEETEGGNC